MTYLFTCQKCGEERKESFQDARFCGLCRAYGEVADFLPKEMLA